MNAQKTKGEVQMTRTEERQIKSAANKSYNVKDLLTRLGYKSSKIGSNTTRKLVRVIGPHVYGELSSQYRTAKPKSRWTKLRVNNKRK